LQEHAQLKNCGLDLYEGVVRDNKKAGVFEPAISKVGTLSFQLLFLPTNT
jgi:T-complex protein 1 subunit alpha